MFRINIRQIAYFLAISAVFIWHTQLVTQFSGDYFYEERFNQTFDSLAESLAKWESQVDPDAIKDEGQFYKRKVYTYFAPFPALLRIPANLILPSMYGNWAKFSCLLASLAGLLGFSLAAFRVTDSFFLRIASILAYGAGSPVVILISSSFIYHEAILWGLAFCMLAIAVIVKDKYTISDFFILSAASGCALISRITFGIPLYLILLYILFAKVIKHKKVSLLPLAALLIPALIAASYYAWYNYSRFGSVLKFSTPSAYKVNIAAIGGDFSYKRIPNGLKNYLGFNKEYFSDCAPFINVNMAEHSEGVLHIYPQGYKESVISLAVISPWMICTFIYMLFNYRFFSASPLYAVAAACFLVQILIIFSHFWITARFLADLIPFFAISYIFYLKYRSAGKTTGSFIGTLIFISIFTVNAAAISWITSENNFMVSKEAKSELQDMLKRINSGYDWCSGNSAEGWRFISQQ